MPRTSPTTSVSRNATASLPSSVSPHMCETSKSEARDLQCLVASMMESPYWMGMDHPAKGTILPVDGEGEREGEGEKEREEEIILGARRFWGGGVEVRERGKDHRRRFLLAEFRCLRFRCVPRREVLSTFCYSRAQSASLGRCSALCFSLPAKRRTEETSGRGRERAVFWLLSFDSVLRSSSIYRSSRGWPSHRSSRFSRFSPSSSPSLSSRTSGLDVQVVQRRLEQVLGGDRGVGGERARGRGERSCGVDARRRRRSGRGRDGAARRRRSAQEARGQERGCAAHCEIDVKKRRGGSEKGGTKAGAFSHTRKRLVLLFFSLLLP